MAAPTPPSEPQGLSVLCFSLRSVEGSPDRPPLIQRLRGVSWDRQLVRDGDRITLDMTARTLDIRVDDAELQRRRAEWTPRETVLRSGVLGKYIKLVGSAAGGAVCG